MLVPFDVVTVALAVGDITVVTVVDPECTPTTLTLDVSTIFSRAHKLLMKLVMTLVLLKKSLTFMAKWVVNWIDSVSSTVAKQLGSSVKMKNIV